MDLLIGDVLDSSDTAAVLQSDVEYSTLVSAYQKIEKSKLSIMNKHRSSFVGLLTKANAERIYELIKQKIIAGLRATDEVFTNRPILLKDVSLVIFNMESTFISYEIINEICSSDTESFVIATNNHGKSVSLKSTEPRIQASTSGGADSARSCGSSITEQLENLYRTRPDVVKALETDVDWETILNTYQFWSEHCMLSHPTFYIKWLIKIAMEHAPCTFAVYEENLYCMVIQAVTMFLESGVKTVLQITNHMCFEKPQFISGRHICEIIEKNADHVHITEDTKTLPVARKKVSLTAKDGEIQPRLDFDLEAWMAKRTESLITIRVSWSSIFSTFKSSLKSYNLQGLIAKYGCFYNFLVESGKRCRPKLATSDFRKHLQNLVRHYIVSQLETKPGHEATISDIVASLGFHFQGLLDTEFIRDTALHFDKEFNLDSSKISLDDANRLQQENDAMVFLESPKILSILSENPTFKDIASVFITLPDIAISALTRKSMCFFKWLQNLCERVKPLNATVFERHLQNIIQQEVTFIHSTQQGPMTVHSIHNRLCKVAGRRQVMFLSINFLCLCLQQESCPCYVQNSRVYLKGTISFDTNSPNREISFPDQQKARKNFFASVTHEIKTTASLVAVLDIIQLNNSNAKKCILGTEACWCDLIENTMEDGKTKEAWTNSLATEARTYLKCKILPVKDLIVSLSRGVPNFVSQKTLKRVLQQSTEPFIFSDPDSEKCYVSLVRRVKSGKAMMSPDEEVLVKQVLLSFPRCGSCEISSVLATATNKNNNPIPEIYVKLLIFALPMLFYVHKGMVVLTSMAIEQCNSYKILCPTNEDLPKSASDDVKEPQTMPKPAKCFLSSCSEKRKKRKVDQSLPIKSQKPAHKDERKENCPLQEISVAESSNVMLPFVDNIEATSLAAVTPLKVTERFHNLKVEGNTILKECSPTEALPLAERILSKVLGSKDLQDIQELDKLLSVFKQKTLHVLREHQSQH